MIDPVTRPNALARLGGSFKRFVRREDGTAGIEFAAVMSLFLVPAWLGFSELAVLQKRMTTLNTTTSMVADMIARYPQVDQANLDDVMTTAQYMFGTDTNRNDLTLMVMGVVLPRENTSGAQEQPWVAWSLSNKPGLKTCVLSDPLPPGLATPTGSERYIIVVDGKLVHDSPLKYARLSPDTLYQRAIYAPRETATRDGDNPCPNPYA